MTKNGKFTLLLSKRVEAIIRNEIDDVFETLSKVIANKIIEDMRGYYLYRQKKRI